MHTEQIKQYIIEPTLKQLNLYSESAVNLLLGTAAQESQMGYYIKQISGPALGMYQMEPATHDDIVTNYLNYRDELKQQVQSIAPINADELMHNLRYSTAMARLHYARVSEALPEANDIEGLARYYKRYYNTPQGKATTDEFINNYQQQVMHER